ncbi:hypothetical protein [Campylobacter corcagiensis]|uniref:DsbA family protein n=1 Tax=Campylobacter corcagiensis TaxID=1448857 RepID=A0A7M1LGV5_9BACT|nr:hypothetical protein [Campylobacter corcagiensis]QKF64234.1 protein disulfide isomerase, DsbG family [Campylobacter corcagiensis]QOQ87573.1 hypothetical protein IMC76_01805 [Campylobacter corcagiensis]
MKKVLLSFGLALMLFGSENFSTNFEQSIKDNFENVEKVEIITLDRLQGVENLNFVIAKIDGNVISALATSNGKGFMALSDFYVLNNADDKKLIDERMKIAKANTKAEQEKVVHEIIKTIPKSRFISIQSFNPDNKFTTYMVTDPECPYCRDEMDKMVKWLRNANVKIIFAPVHGKSAYTKSALMLNESKDINSSDQKAMIKLISKYYDKNATVDDNAVTEEERDLVLDDAKKLFSKGVIKGVPFTFTVEEKF